MNFNLLSHLTCPQFICVLDKKLSIQDQHAWLTPQLLFLFVLFSVNDLDLKVWNFPPVNRECRGAVKRVTGILKNSFCFCMCCLSGCCDKMPDEKNPRKEGLFRFTPGECGRSTTV